MSAFMFMNAADSILQGRGHEHYIQAGSFPVSAMLVPMLQGMSDGGLIFLERFCWWFHIIGILAFLNYLPYSKHFHILLAFPATYYANLEAKGSFRNLDSVSNEVKLMLDPSAVPPPSDGSPQRFGAKDVFDLNWKQLLDAYTAPNAEDAPPFVRPTLPQTAIAPKNIDGYARSFRGSGEKY
jgi:hypothetical protein